MSTLKRGSCSGQFRLRGKSDPTSVLEILGSSQIAQALAAFQGKEWVLAAGLFEAIARRYVNHQPVLLSLQPKICGRDPILRRARCQSNE